MAIDSYTCWICGSSANSREHKTKKSDLRDVFGSVSQRQPLYYHNINTKTKNLRIGSLNSDILKSPTKICASCNNARTQPHDYAWEHLSIRLNSNTTTPHQAVRANKIFNYNTNQQMLNVHLYFVKLFGCHIIEGGIPIDIKTFSDAIMHNKAHPNVYLKFGLGNGNEQTMVGMSDIHTAETTDNKKCAFATWFYILDKLAVNVMFAIDGEKRNGLINAWHPKFGTNKLLINQF